jgi:predicted tellurium resistance membrane protein TerC
MEKFPAIITMGAALLGFVSGEMAVTDLAIHDWFEAHLHGMDTAVSITCAVGVVLVGTYLSRRQAKAAEAKP